VYVQEEGEQMPTILRVYGYRFHFYAYDCREPRHVHVEKGEAEAKFWLDPVTLASNHGFTTRQLQEIERLIREHYAALVKGWDDFCNRFTP
jgi:hypothetical protein